LEALPTSNYLRTLLTLFLFSAAWAEPLAAEDTFGGGPLAEPVWRDPELWNSGAIWREEDGVYVKMGNGWREEPPGEEGPPILPEPMVFDLVRPLGARRGELEVNVLGMVPLNRASAKGTSPVSDPLGLVPRSKDRQGIEWAPEIEIALWDGFAIEFELPFEESRLEAYKAAVQWTFGTGLDNQFIHGTQVILEYEVDEPLWTPTFLYLAGLRIDPVWSVLMMYGFRTEFAGGDIFERTETIVNGSVFAEVTDRIVLGVETNYAGAMSGLSTWLVMPQIHVDVTDRITIQGGVGSRFAADFTLPEAGFRVIGEF
jgi:hypothetical protein